MQIKKAIAEIATLANAGMKIDLVHAHTQPYVRVRKIDSPSPPWDKESQDILIVLPIAYDLGTGLDAFYLKLPYEFQGGQHNRVNGDVIQVANDKWKLVSWHYADGKEFRPTVDTLESHIMHCKGFFFHRGATNAHG